MPLVHFVDEELIEEINKKPKNDEEENKALEDHQFIANCLQIGLRLDDLKQLEYKDVAKIMLCFSNNSNQPKKKKATQADWDKLAGRR